MVKWRFMFWDHHPPTLAGKFRLLDCLPFSRNAEDIALQTSRNSRPRSARRRIPQSFGWKLSWTLNPSRVEPRYHRFIVLKTLQNFQFLRVILHPQMSTGYPQSYGNSKVHLPGGYPLAIGAGFKLRESGYPPVNIQKAIENGHW